MGAKRPRAQKMTPLHRTEARVERERRRLHDAVDPLLASRVAQGFTAKVGDPTRVGTNRRDLAGA
jgi:hypothetical protein